MNNTNQKRMIRFAALLLSLLLLFGGCARPQKTAKDPAAQSVPTDPPAPAAVSADPPAAEDEPAAPALEEVPEVTDCAGRTVLVPKEAKRVACLYAYTGHVLAMLGCEDRIVAVVNGLKRDQLMLRKLPSIADMACPYSSGSINIEELASVSPDLIFLRAENLADEGETEKLDSLKIPYLVVDYVTMEDQIYSIEMMGKALGQTLRAKEYTEYYRNTVEMVKERVSHIPEAERIRVYHSVNEVVRTDVPGTLSYEVLDAAGCRNVVTSANELRLDSGKGMTTVEQIYVWDPDAVLVTEPDAAAYFRTNEKFSGLRAVTEGNVFQLPVGMSRWAHPGSLESPLAALYIAKLLYPKLFDDIDMKAEISAYYERFFGIPLSEEDLDSIVSGQGMRDPKEGKNE